MVFFLFKKLNNNKNILIILGGAMNINIFKESVIGYKNIIKSSTSQDFCIYKIYDKCIICAVADGHSSSRFKYSHIGSELACEAILDILEIYLSNKSMDIFVEDFKNKKIQHEIKNKWKKLVYDDFYKRNYKAYKIDYVLYGTTLSFVILLDENILFFNLGDGIILSKKNDLYEKIFENNNYRIVNSLADDKCEEKMQYKILKRDEKIQLVLSTDGFINSFDTYDELKVELDNNLKMLNKNVFSNFYFKKMYKNYLYNLSKYKSFDDISIIFIYN